MRRYAGGPLPPRARIALISFDSLGNYVVATPLAQMLRAKFPDAEFHYFGGSRTRELSSRARFFDKVHDLYGTSPAESLRGLQPFDWVVNIEANSWSKAFANLAAGESGYVTGPCVAPDGRGDMLYPPDEIGDLARDRNWQSDEVRVRHTCLKTPFIGEIFCRLAYLEGEIPHYSVSSDPVEGRTPDVVFAMTASLADKLWPVENWIGLARYVEFWGYSVGLVGAKPSKDGPLKGVSDEDALISSAGIQDWRGRLTLPQVCGLLEQAKLVVTLDNGIAHLACSTPTPTIGLYRHGIHRLWAPPASNLQVVEPGPNRPVAGISLSEVTELLKNLQIQLPIL